MSGMSSQRGSSNDRDQLIAETLESKYGSWLGKRYFGVFSMEIKPTI